MIAELSRLSSHATMQEMRTWKEAEDAGKKVGFELVTSLDLAVASSVCGPWYEPKGESLAQYSLGGVLGRDLRQQLCVCVSGIGAGE